MKLSLSLKNSLQILFTLTVCVVHWPGLAQTSLIDGILVRADATEGFTEKNRFILTGNVQVAYDGQSILCDKAIIDVENTTVEAIGNVVMDDPNTHLEADRVKLNYKTNRGEIDNGFIQSGQVVVEGLKMKKIGDQVYWAEDAEFTSCTTCPPGWSFSGKEIEAELGGYAKIKRPIFKLGGFPFLPLPWIMVPLKTERQSGFLVPSYEYSQRGHFALTGEYFWAISKSQDATLGLTYHELLGLKWQSEYRFVLSETSSGELHGSYINDRLFDSELKTAYPGANSINSRWYYQYSHMMQLPNGFTQRIEYTDISDLDYLKDFPNDLEELGASSGDSALENKVSISKNFEQFHMSAEALMFKNLVRAYPLADNSDAVHKIPEIQIRSSEVSLWDSGPFVHLDVNSAHFVRDRYSYDDLKNNSGSREPTAAPARYGEYVRDGQFDPTVDLLRTGHRLDVTSRLHYPFQVFKLFEVSPSVSVREMQYRFQVDEDVTAQGFSQTAAQRYIQTDLGVSTEINGFYGEDQSFAEKYKHTMIPKISYSNIPWIRRPDHLFFGQFEEQRFNTNYAPVSDQDLNGVNRLQFDYRDRVFDKDLVTFSFRNELTRKSFVNGDPQYTRLASLEVNQSYDINESRSPNSQAWSNIQSRLTLGLEHVALNADTSYNPYARLVNSTTILNLIPEPGNYFQISYAKETLVDENNNILSGAITENLGLGLGMSTPYWDLVVSMAYSKISREIQEWQYTSRFKPPGNCWYIDIFHRQALGGATNLKANIAFNFDGI